MRRETAFWVAVRELAALRDRVPPERRQGSNVLAWLREQRSAK